jgi:photoactive yellow protein
MSASAASLSPLFANIESMNEKELDALPHGAIQLDNSGKVLKFNAYEERLAGMIKANVLGRNFFKQVAPCTDVKEFYGRFLDGVAAKKLHCKFRYRFAFKQNPRDVTVTLFYCERDSSVWVFVQPLDAQPPASPKSR